MEEGTSLQYIFNFFRGKKNPKNGLYAEFNSGYNPFFRFSIPVTQSERRFFFLKKNNLGQFHETQVYGSLY